MDNSEQEKEINDLSDFNSRLIERIGLFYLPSWKNISKYEFYKKDDGYIIKKIYDMQSNVSYRSATMILYKQFDIFKPVISQIEAATFCFFEKNYIATCFTLAPIVDGLLLQWNKGKDIAKKSERDIFLDKKINEISGKHNNNVYVSCELNLLRCFINKYFERYTNNEKAIDFNRNRLAHLLKATNNDECFIYSLHLLGVLDLIVWCYSYEFPYKDGINDFNWHQKVCEEHKTDFLYYYELFSVCNKYAKFDNIIGKKA